MTNLPTIMTLRRTALDALAALRNLSPSDQLTPLWTLLHRQEVEKCLAILERDSLGLPGTEEREAARQAAAEIRRAII